MAIDILSLAGEMSSAIEFDASNNPIYVGEAKPSTAPSSTGWRVKRITFDVSNNPTNVEWAEGTAEFDKVWDDRLIYRYS